MISLLEKHWVPEGDDQVGFDELKHKDKSVRSTKRLPVSRELAHLIRKPIIYELREGFGRVQTVDLSSLAPRLVRK